MANRVQEDHKLIVGIEGSRSGDVPSHSPKDSIPGKRGIVYFTADGSSESTSGNTPSVDEDGNKEEGTIQPDAGGDSAGTSGGKYNSGNKAADVGLSDPYPVDDAAQAGSGIFGVDTMTLGDIVNGVTGLKDCATNQPVDVRFDGQFTAPDGWDNPDSHTAPAFEDDGTFQDGYVWHWHDNANYFPTVSAAYAADSWPADHRLYFDGSSWRAQTQNQLDQWYNVALYDSHPILFRVTDEDYAAMTDPVVAAEWPSEKPMQLSYNAEIGQYETHPMDGNKTPEYSQATGSFQLCNEAGDPITSYAQADGGQAIMNETTGIATFIDSSGKVTGFGDGAAVTNGQPR